MDISRGVAGLAVQATALGIKTPGRSATQITVIGRDAINEQFRLIVVDDANVQVPNTGGVILSRLACRGSDGLWHTLQVTEVEDCDSNGNKYYRLVVASERYSPH